jgi:hypothetical protein
VSHYVCFTGGRDFDDEDAVMAVVEFLVGFYGDDLRIMHGGAKGADSLAQKCADWFGVRTKTFPADWGQHGKAAGPIRNIQMADYLVMCRSKGHSVQVVAFRGGSGTEHMVKQAESRQIDVDRC